jgi:hypothetical protein
MRKLLTQLLIVFMCMPYLACAMPACGHETAIIQSEIQPCASHNNVAEYTEHETPDLMFMRDCMGVDVQLIQHDSSLQAADFKVSDTAIYSQDIATFKAQRIVESTTGRLWDTRSYSPPNIILTTQRFRL